MKFPKVIRFYMGKRKRIKLIAAVALILPALIVLYYMLQPLVDYLIYSLVGLNAETHLGAAINFFSYDTIKILILLFHPNPMQMDYLFLCFY